MEKVRSLPHVWYGLVGALFVVLPLVLPPFAIHLLIMTFMTCTATLSWTIIGASRASSRWGT